MASIAEKSSPRKELLTLDDLRGMTKETITPAVAAQVLQCDPQWIRVAARQDKARLGFPVVLIGSRVKIPRIAFIRYMEGASADV